MNRSTFSEALQQPVSKASSANTSAGLRNLHQLIQLGVGRIFAVRARDQIPYAAGPLRPADKVEHHHPLILAAGNVVDILIQLDAYHHPQRILRRIRVEQGITDLLDLGPVEVHDVDPPQLC